MLFTISRGNVPGAEGVQSAIVHLVADVETVARSGHAFVFTDGHAVMALTNFFNDLAELRQLDWDSVNSRNWGAPYDATLETKRKKQAEFLVHHELPWDAVHEIGVMTEESAVTTRQLISVAHHQPPVTVRPDWYY